MTHILLLLYSFFLPCREFDVSIQCFCSHCVRNLTAHLPGLNTASPVRMSQHLDKINRWWTAMQTQLQPYNTSGILTSRAGVH
ncbi:uncharacterized protein ARMOST_17407 [Armillaria ostoyae]|uniref:Secreted protein n=1 Tax=Armillaria ostoyae TaxID=47428 RepID=A0A284RYW3_ARMOS|nr:uncharacterized protein ARMOST_17407 [Armillaria ostoyae]